ncbi:MAG: hypothetical protein FJ144_21055 [Deltaproteobacteria bacterium]|nr:hypothetical protein [Deltaproteobacteria bacterium]
MVSCDVAAMCWAEGGEIRGDGIRAYCCKTSGSGADQITVCDEVDQLIDLDFIQKSPPKSTRPFGAPSRFQRR